MEAADTHALPAGITVLERGWLSANNILFHGVGRTALIDSGYATHSAQTVAWPAKCSSTAGSVAEPPFFVRVHRLWFADMSLDHWIERLAEDLVRAGAAAREGEQLINA